MGMSGRLVEFMKDLACTFDQEKGRWLVRVPFALPVSTLERVRLYLLKVQLDRRLGCSPGDRADALERGIKALEEKNLDQAVIGAGEVAAFQSTERMRPDRLIVDMNGGSNA